MSTEIVPFNFDGEQVRVVAIDGEPWFVLADLCAVLSLSNPSVVASRIDEAALSLTEVRSGGQRRSVTIVSEAGMYEVVIRSDKPEAAAFRRWITGTVLPEIRKTGSYGAQLALTDDQIVHQALTILTAKTAELEAKVEADAPKVAYVDQFVADSDLRLLRNVAKSMGMTEGDLRADLLDRKWLYTDHTTRWSESKQEKETITRYSAYSHKSAYFYPVPNHLAPRFKGEVMHTLKVTPQGAVAIARLYGKQIDVTGEAFQ